MRKHKNTAVKGKKGLDKVSRKSRSSLIYAARKKRGRPGIRATEIAGRAANYRNIFERIWEQLREPLIKAENEKDVTQAFAQFGQPYSQEFVPHQSGLILKVLRESKFPKRPDSQIAFLADSLAGLGRVSPRTSRDICDKERRRIKHKIIRQDFYIECTCKYKGPAFHGKCPKCGTGEIELNEAIFGNIVGRIL